MSPGASSVERGPAGDGQTWPSASFPETEVDYGAVDRLQAARALGRRPLRARAQSPGSWSASRRSAARPGGLARRLRALHGGEGRARQRGLDGLDRRTSRSRKPKALGALARGAGQEAVRDASSRSSSSSRSGGAVERLPPTAASGHGRHPDLRRPRQRRTCGPTPTCSSSKKTARRRSWPECRRTDFSATGQLWGNPLYRWDEMARTGLRRGGSSASAPRFELGGPRAPRPLPRLRGVLGDPGAASRPRSTGAWVKGPGAALFEALRRPSATLPIVAENLGVITPEVERCASASASRAWRSCSSPSASDAQGSTFIPHNYPRQRRDLQRARTTTTPPWAGGRAASGDSHAHARKEVEREHDSPRRYMNSDGKEIHWDFIRTLLGSVAETGDRARCRTCSARERGAHEPARPARAATGAGAMRRASSRTWRSTALLLVHADVWPRPPVRGRAPVSACSPARALISLEPRLAPAGGRRGGSRRWWPGWCASVAVRSDPDAPSGWSSAGWAGRSGRWGWALAVLLWLIPLWSARAGRPPDLLAAWQMPFGESPVERRLRQLLRRRAPAPGQWPLRRLRGTEADVPGPPLSAVSLAGARKPGPGARGHGRDPGARVVPGRPRDRLAPRAVVRALRVRHAPGPRTRRGPDRRETEPLGMAFRGSRPGRADLLQRPHRRPPGAPPGSCSSTLAMQVRPGAQFVLLFLALWMPWHFRAQRARALAWAAAALVWACFSPAVLGRVYGAGESSFYARPALLRLRPRARHNESRLYDDFASRRGSSRTRAGSPGSSSPGPCPRFASTRPPSWPPARAAPRGSSRRTGRRWRASST
mgnify:CR=1 FL=1